MSIRSFSGLRVTFTQKTALFEWCSQQMGGKMVPFAGYEMPVEFKQVSGGLLKEHLHCREQASLFDVSHMGQLQIRGKDRVEFIDKLIVGDLFALENNNAFLSLLMMETGGIKDDTVITKYPDFLSMVVNGACKETDIEHINRYLDEFKQEGKDVELLHLTEQALIALQGPKAAESLQRLIPQVQLNDLKFMQGLHTTLNALNNTEITVTRCGYTGEDGFEISVPNDKAAALADLLITSSNQTVLPAGLGARDSLRLEAGLCLYGHDIDESTSPIEAALNWTISKKKKTQGGFLGDSVVLNQLENGVTRKRVGLVGTAGASAREGTVLEKNGEQVGVVTSGSQSPLLKKPIGMGYVDFGNHKIGRKLEANLRGKKVEMAVTKMPFVATNYFK